MKIIIAITGASGSIYAQDIIERLIKLEQQIEAIAIVRSTNANFVWKHELDSPWPEHRKIKYFDSKDFMAPFASGSSAWDSMIIVPASMGTIGRIANGISDDLITRAADVMFKEQRQILVCPREMPFNKIHLRNLMTLQDAGATIMTTSPSFYSKPQNIRELIGTVTSRIIDHLSLKQNETFRWGE